MVSKGTKKGHFGRWERASVKEDFWRTKIAQWQVSGLTVRAFARSNNISENSFYAWRRELQIRDREASTPLVCAEPGATQAVETRVSDSKGRLVPLRFREQVPLVSAGNPFVSLSIKESSDSKAADTAGITGQIQLQLPGRAVISITPDADLTLLARLLTTLELTQC
ncbi:MAG: transposase [Candidatus Obscuribacterales bacterium]|nr:transposase [Candidatus Obscuribacterales bacterium]